MKVAISNLNFDQELNLDVLRQKFKYLEIAPTKLFSGWDVDVRKVEALKNYDFEIVGLQSIFYGYEYNCFEDLKLFLSHLKTVKNICHQLSTKYVVFGSPKNRNTNEIDYYKKFNKILKEMSSVLEGITIGLELNPKEYKSKVFNNLEDIEKMQFNNNIKFHFDTGCVSFLTDDLNSVYSKYKDIIGNIHISEKFLGEFVYTEKHKNFSEILENKTISLEALNSSWESIEKYKKTYEKNNL